MSARYSFWKSLWSTLLFYGSFAVAIAVLEYLQPTNMCNPGAGVVAFLLLCGCGVGLMLLHIGRALAGADLQRLGIAALHLLALVGVAAVSLGLG